MYKISIITINRNNAAGLERTIESVINQTYTNIEYIIIDGASTDNSIGVIKKYKDKIYFWVSESDRGIYNAMNKGLKKASGDYIFFLNSGDYLYENLIIEKICSLTNNEEVVYGDIRIFINNKINRIRSTKEVDFFKRYQHDLPPQPAVLIKKDVLEKVGPFDENYKIIVDVVLIANVFRSEKVRYKSLGILITVFNTDGISSRQENQRLIYEERKRFILKEFPHYLSDFELIYKRNLFYKFFSVLKGVWKKQLIRKLKIVLAF